MTNAIDKAATNDPRKSGAAGKSPYVKPELRRLGSVEQLTAGSAGKSTDAKGPHS